MAGRAVERHVGAGEAGAAFARLTEPVPVPEATATGKQHYEVLDGMRGTAALLVVFYHVSGLAVNWDGTKVLLHHATLAVDFFFMLSGFVLGYAYDDRWPVLTVVRFVRLRLVRLHPLLVLGTLLGFASYLLDPFAAGRQEAGGGALAAALAFGLLALPQPMLPGRWDDTHSLNGPSWSLLQEYLGSLAYALVLRRLPARALAGVAILSGAVLVACAVARNGLDAGWGWDNLWMAPVRLCYPFVTGLWLHRVHRALPRWRAGHLALSVVLVALFAAPTLPVASGVAWNGVFEAACVVVAFPLVVLAGAHSGGGPRSLALCKACGRLSYPLYITHFPFLYVWGNYVTGWRPPLSTAIPVAAAILPLLILFAWAAHQGWDLPVRRRLSGRQDIAN